METLEQVFGGKKIGTYLPFEVPNWFIYASVCHCGGDQDIQDGVRQMSSVIVFAI